MDIENEGEGGEENASQGGKIWKLAGGVMSVIYVGLKKPGDKEMIVELEFLFDHDVDNPRTVGKQKLT